MLEENVQDETVDETEVEETEEDSTEDTEESDVDWKARALKAEKTIVDNKRSSKKEPEINNSTESERLDRMELRQDGYPPEVVDKIMELGGKEALKNPIVKRAADDLLAQHNAEKAGDIASGPNSTTKTKYSNEDLKEMSSEEMEKVLPHAD
jgi:FtsZ-interacting cell division protein ZipA